MPKFYAINDVYVGKFDFVSEKGLQILPIFIPANIIKFPANF